MPGFALKLGIVFQGVREGINHGIGHETPKKHFSGRNFCGMLTVQPEGAVVPLGGNNMMAEERRT
jgi:hypothetical protein